MLAAIHDALNIWPWLRDEAWPWLLSQPAKYIIGAACFVLAWRLITAWSRRRGDE